MKKLLPSVSGLKFWGALALMAGTLAGADTPFWVEPCTDPATGCKAGDLDLARWALAAWETASGGRLHFVETKERSQALIRLIWASQNGGLYGETVAINVKGHHGSEIYIVNTTQGIKDDLLRDTIVYLTCLHESGHALGMQHTDQFPDIMYYFGFGGDINEYFGRYRRKLSTREDIRKNPGMSPADRTQLMQRLPEFEAR